MRKFGRKLQRITSMASFKRRSSSGIHGGAEATASIWIRFRNRPEIQMQVIIFFWNFQNSRRSRRIRSLWELWIFWQWWWSCREWRVTEPTESGEWKERQEWKSSDWAVWLYEHARNGSWTGWLAEFNVRDSRFGIRLADAWFLLIWLVGFGFTFEFPASYQNVLADLFPFGFRRLI